MPPDAAPPWAPVAGMIWVFGWALLGVLVWFVSGQRRERRLEREPRERLAAIEKGVPLVELPRTEAPTHRPAPTLHPRWALGVAALSASVGLGTSVALWLSGDPEHNRVWPFGLIGVF